MIHNERVVCVFVSVREVKKKGDCNHLDSFCATIHPISRTVIGKIGIGEKDGEKTRQTHNTIEDQ